MKPSQPNNMHLGGDGKHPFAKSWKNSRPTAKMVGVFPPPGGEGKLASANANIKRSLGPLNGPGKAR
jgi:hypothetical protein